MGLIRQQVNSQFFMDKRKDLGDFKKGQVVIARPLGQSFSRTAGLVKHSKYAVVSIKSGPRNDNW